MIELLNARFVNAWTLAKDLERMCAEKDLDPGLRAFAKKLLDDYTYPVDTQIRETSARMLAHRSANDVMMHARGMEPGYLELLRSALE